MTARGPGQALGSSLRLQGKKLAYNLAADTWPGWNEPGIVITTSDLDAGLDAAAERRLPSPGRHAPP